MVVKNAKTDLLSQDKKFAKGDTSYSSFWLYNRERDMKTEFFRDTFVDFYNDKELLSEFNPTVAKNIISFWSKENDLILDPFSGRTRALVSNRMNRNYIGYEVSKDVVDYMLVKFNELKILNNDSYHFIEIHNRDCLEIENDYKGECVDMVFSCPPYWNLEKYESVDGQLSDIKDYNEFLDELEVRLGNACNVLKVNKYMCMVVGDFRRKGKYVTFHADLIDRMKKNKGLKLHDVVVMQNIPFGMAACYFGNRKLYDCTAKAHEYLLVWKKIGDGKVE